MTLLSAGFLLLADRAMAIPPFLVPDVGSSGLLLGMAFAGIIVVRNFLGKK